MCAILGGISGIGETFVNNLGYNMLSQIGGNVMTNAIFANGISLTFGSVMVAGSLIGSAIPQYNVLNTDIKI